MLDIFGTRRLEQLTKGLSEAEARAYRLTNNLQVIMISLPTLLIFNVLFVEPPETHAFSFTNFAVLIAVMIPARVLLFKKWIAASAALTLLNVNAHITALCVAFADDPAYLAYLLFSFMPFLMFPSRHKWLRVFFVGLPAVQFLVYQYYYRALGGSGLFGPPKWTGSADYFMPPITLLLFFTILIIYQFVKAVDVAEDKLSREIEKSEALLLNVLPRPIAERLKENPETIADGFEATTVLFSDIVGFTELSQTVSPPSLVKLLNGLFSRFDDLADQFGLEKIKTIGDAYMVVAGLPERRDDHATAIAGMALGMRNVLDEYSGKIGKPLRIRIGMHSGPVVAGVIGKRKFSYDVWGDTVNTAARMESHGVAGEIQVSEATYNLLQSEFSFESRGTIEIKGKGAMQTWLLKGRR